MKEQENYPLPPHFGNTLLYDSNYLKEGDVIEISGFYFTWQVKIGYSEVLKKEGVYAIAQGGLIHSDLEGDIILSINGVAV